MSSRSPRRERQVAIRWGDIRIMKMKKFALAAVAVALSAGAAFAENPNVGTPADLYANDRTPVAAQQVDHTATASIGQSSFQDGSAHRFGDASPSSFQN